MLNCVRDVAHYPSCTDSIKPSLHFSCNFVVINASKGSLSFQTDCASLEKKQIQTATVALIVLATLKGLTPYITTAGGKNMAWHHTHKK
jgi:hypothetical protein